MNSVYVSTAQYLRAHGRPPRGRGGWAFFFDRNDAIDSAFWVYNSTYADARKVAVQEARRRGCTYVEVGS